MKTLTEEQRREVREASEPPHFIDPETNQEYVLIRLDAFEKMKSLLYDDTDFDPREASSLIWQVMKEDWEDPAMDVYDEPPENS